MLTEGEQLQAFADNLLEGEELLLGEQLAGLRLRSIDLAILDREPLSQFGRPSTPGGCFGLIDFHTEAPGRNDAAVPGATCLSTDCSDSQRDVTLIQALYRHQVNSLQHCPSKAHPYSLGHATDLYASSSAQNQHQGSEDVPSSVELRWRSGEHQAALT